MSGRWYRTMLYFRLPEGKSPETVRGELPRLANGVGVYGGSEYVVVKNLIAKHFWNDGYNIHNASKNITFENIAAISAGDWKRLCRRSSFTSGNGRCFRAAGSIVSSLRRRVCHPE